MSKIHGFLKFYLQFPKKICILAFLTDFRFMRISPNRALLIGILIGFFAAFCIANTAFSQRIHFTSGSGISTRSAHRVERFLSHVFPTRQMKRYARSSDAKAAQASLIYRDVNYEMVSQNGVKFILAGFTGWWTQPIHVIAVYRMEEAGPNQVWRSLPWSGAASDLHFSTAKVKERNLVLFQEGGNEGGFALASIFTFRNEPQGLFIRDLTPELPWLRAKERFPLRPLYGQQIRLSEEPNLSSPNEHDIILHATDEEYNLGMAQHIRPSRIWKYNSIKDRFEPSKNISEPAEAEQMH